MRWTSAVAASVGLLLSLTATHATAAESSCMSLANATAFAPRGEVYVEVRANCGEDDFGVEDPIVAYVELLVSDLPPIARDVLVYPERPNAREMLLFANLSLESGSSVLVRLVHRGEIRSLVVSEEARKQGIGRSLVDRCLEEAAELGLQRIFVLTFNSPFFERLRFIPISKSLLPHKIWAECIRCIHFPDCKEEALLLELQENSSE